MLFSSFTFLFFFLPASLLLYFPLPAALGALFPRAIGKGGTLLIRNAVLLVLSLFFYAWGEPVYLLLMLATTLFNYLIGLLLPRAKHRKALLCFAVFSDLAVLFYFKYAPFFLSLLGISLTVPHMPIGISFYTFQAISYVIDVYRGGVRAERSLLRFGTYIALFPQLIAGPIVRYSDVASALGEREHSVPRAARGARRFAAGLAKKVVLANPAGALFQSMVALPNNSLSATGAWLALIGFFFQIYFDFSGYSDMAIGLGELFGFSFPENFDYPYTARSITDFWRRWHITLSSFFREYVYFPLGGSRKGKVRTLLNLLAVWSLTGLWHGASWNFILWGIYYFVLLVLEKFLLCRMLPHLPRVLSHVLTLAAVLFGWLLFAFDGSTDALSLSVLGSFIPALFGKNGVMWGEDAYHLLRHLPFFAIAALGATPLPRHLYRRLSNGRAGGTISLLLPLAALVLSLAYLADASFNPFLYFRF